MATNRQNVKSATGEPSACVSASSRILQTSSSLFRSQMRPLGRQGQGSQSSGKERELPRVPMFVTELVLCALLPRPLGLCRRTEDGGTGGLVEMLSLLCTPRSLSLPEQSCVGAARSQRGRAAACSPRGAGGGADEAPPHTSAPVLGAVSFPRASPASRAARGPHPSPSARRRLREPALSLASPLRQRGAPGGPVGLSNPAVLPRAPPGPALCTGALQAQRLRQERLRVIPDV